MDLTNPLYSLLQAALVPAQWRQEPWGPGWALPHIWSELKKQLVERAVMPFHDPFTTATGATGQGGKIPSRKTNLADDW